jgi:hypothetical protein
MTLPRHGTVEQPTRRLGEVLEVVAVSPPSPDRGASVLVRVYLEARPGPAPPAAPGRPASPARRPRP